VAVAGEPTVESLRRRDPEWAPWLALVELTREEVSGGAWDGAVPSPAAAGDDPALSGARIVVDGGLAGRWVARLARAAGLADRRGIGPAEALAVLRSGLDGEIRRLGGIAALLHADPAALGALAPLAAAPLLHACRRAWQDDPCLATWRHGCCPVCGAWATLAEARGLERSRRLRCAACGADWAFDWLRCPFCDNGDHLRLGGLAPDAALDTRRVETCAACSGYVKTVTALRPTPPQDLTLLDTATVELDVAALEAGYRRPAGRGRALGATVEARRRPSLAPWRR